VPSACDIAQIALPPEFPGIASTPGEGLNGDFVETFALLASSAAKSFVQSIRHITDCILHASVVGVEGCRCKQRLNHEWAGPNSTQIRRQHPRD